MDKKISRVYCYIAEDILEEYASSYSQVDKERIAKTLQDMVNEKVEKFAEMVSKAFIGLNCIDIDEWNWCQRKIDGICKEIVEGK